MGAAIEKLIVERWSRLVQARIESLLEAYEQFEIRLEAADIESFVDKLNAARPNILASFIHHVGGRGGGSLQLGYDFEQINMQARQKLFFELTRVELKRKRTKEENKMKKKNDAGVHIGGNVVGSSIQVGGKKNEANVSTVLNTQFNENITQLREAFEQSKELDNVDKEEASKKIDKLTVWATREENPRRLEKVPKGIGTLVGIASKAKD